MADDDVWRAWRRQRVGRVALVVSALIVGVVGWRRNSAAAAAGAAQQQRQRQQKLQQRCAIMRSGQGRVLVRVR